jgi:hypothetical protein
MGSVTNPTGSVNGKNLATLVDAYAGNWGGITQPLDGAQAQWNYANLLSAVVGACAREGSGSSYAPSELTLQLVLVGYADLPNPAPVFPPAADLPLVLTVGGWTQTSDGVYRQVRPQVMQATRQGKAGNSTAATGGAVTFTRLDGVEQDGSYTLAFPNGGSAAGSFVAPWCGPAPQ